MPSDQHGLERLLAGERIAAVGLMSGTSADGIDAAVVDLWLEADRPHVELRAFETFPYSNEVRAGLFRCFSDQATVREVCLLDAAVGEEFADAAERIVAGLDGAVPLAFVATHGQTIWHEPAGPGRSTLQIGQAARIAVRLGVPVVSDFRQQDFALGGQGAPLVPYLDHLLFAHSTRSRACQNLGGIGNVTYLPAGAGPEAVIAFDTGPANALMDRAAALVSEGQLTCDRDGLLAASAPVDEALLSELLSEPYLDQAPPKSTGRELFSAERVDQLWARGFRGAGLVSTLTQYTVRTIADAYQRWLGAVDEVILAGGGVRNPELVRRLREALPKTEVRTADELGLNSDAKEAIAFAMFGYETLRGRPSNVPAATGAARAAIQGKITWP
jgi:anhydro-N-acetylmuramic acid kinase